MALVLVSCQASGPAIGSYNARPTAAPTETIEVPVFLPTIATETIQPVSPTRAGITPWVTEGPVPVQSRFDVQVHPDGALYLGDQVSFEVIAPEGFPAAGKKAEVRLGGPEGALIGEGEFGPFGLDERIQATVLWGWDTAGLAAGEQLLTFMIKPDGPLWSETFTLLPYGQLSSAERQAHWATAQNGCCIVHYITGTAAERDLPDLLKMFDDQADLAASRLGVLIGKKVEVALVPRVLGHGGFAGEGITLSYLDSNYAGGSREMLFHHELIHILDARLGGRLRLPFLVEGLAVFLSGGHFKPEPLLQRAAALLPPEPGCERSEMRRIQ